MGTLILKLLRFFGHNFINFTVITIVLAFGTLLYNEAMENLATQSTYSKWQAEFDSFVNKQREDAKIASARPPAWGKPRSRNASGPSMPN